MITSRNDYFISIRCKMTTNYIVVITCLFAIGAQSINLANSSYPMYKANPEKNNQLNTPFLCASVTPGRTLVFNDTWTSPSVLNAVLLPPILSEDQFYMVANESSQYSIRSYSLGRKPSWSGASFPYINAIPTILRDGTVALSGINNAALVSEDLSQLLASWTNHTAQVVAALVPFGDTYLLLETPNDPEDGYYNRIGLKISDSSYSYSKSVPITLLGFFVNQNSTQIGGEAIVRLLIQSLTTISASLALPYTGPSAAVSQDFGPLHPDVDPFMVGQVAYIFTNDSSVGVVAWDIDNITNWQNTPFPADIWLLESPIIRGTKSLGSFSSSTGDVIMDFFNNITLFEGKRFAGPPTYSIPDNVAVFTTVDQNGELQLMGLNMDTWEVKATGLFDQVPPYAKVSEAVFDGNCNVYVTVDNGVIHTLSPLPISHVVPMIECVDEFNVAYFSYNNYEEDGLRIPYVVDRNALTPSNITPTTLFKVGQGDQYPFSARVQLQNASATYQWRLEDYLLTFSITPQLACPRNVSLTLTFTATANFNQSSFVNIVVDALVAVTGVRGARVSILNVNVNNNSARRNIRQSESTLQLELEISAGNSSEPTAAEIVTDLINNQYTEFNNQVTSSPDAPTDTRLNDIVPKVAPVTPQSGVLTPLNSTSPLPSNSPQPSTDTPLSAPITRTVSSSSRVVALKAVLFAVTAFVLSLNFRGS